MLFGFFYTQLGVQGMEGISEIQNYLAPVLPYYAPSYILVLIVANRVILFLYRVHKKKPKWDQPHIFWTLLWNIYPNNFPSSRFNHLSRASTPIWPSNMGISKLTFTLKEEVAQKWLFDEYSHVSIGRHSKMCEKFSIISSLSHVRAC